MKKGDKVYAVQTNLDVYEGTFTGKVVKFLSLMRIEVEYADGSRRLNDVERCVPKDDDSTALLEKRASKIREAATASQAAQTALEKLWFKRVSPQQVAITGDPKEAGPAER